jgi:hypothetical protein
MRCLMNEAVAEYLQYLEHAHASGSTPELVAGVRSSSTQRS